MRRLCFLVLLVVLVATSAARPAPSSAVVEPAGDFMGMVIRDPFNEWGTDQPEQANQRFYDELGRNLAAMGVRWVRFEFRAEDGVSYDPSNGGQGIRFAAYDYFVNEVAPRYGFKIIALLATQLVKDPWYIDPEKLEPAKATGADEGEVPECWNYRYGCGTTKAMRILLDHSFAIAERYGDRIAAYELLNEQNRYFKWRRQGH